MSRIAHTLTRVIDWFYIGPVRKVIPLQTFRYAACGGLNVVLGWVLYAVIYDGVFAPDNLDLGFVVISPHVATLCVCFPVTFFLGFYLNKYVAFKRSPLRSRTQLIRYVLSVSGSLALNYMFIKVFVEAFHIYPTFAQVIATLLITVYSYMMQKYFTFRGCDEQ